MSGILEKIAPEIKLYKYLGKSIQELKETFERNWPDKGLDWKIKSIDAMITRVREEVQELDEAMTDAWSDAYLHQSLIYRLRQVLLEWKDVALVALMGIDRTMMEIESLEERLRIQDTTKVPVKEQLGSDGEKEIVEEVVEDIYDDNTEVEDYNGC